MRAGQVVRALFAAFAIPVGVGVALFAVLALRGDSEEMGGRGFYLEALIVVDESARTVGTDIAGGGSLAGERDHHETLVRWWYRDARHFRVEYETVSSQPEAGGGFTYVRDGDRLWSYDAAEQTYTRTDADAFPAVPPGSLVTLPSFSILLGWAPGGLDQLLSILDEVAAASEGTVEVTGEAEWMGRTVTVIEMTPAASSQVNDGPVEGDGFVRYSFDEATGFVVMNEAESEVVSYRAEVTMLDTARAIPRSRFVFTPPPGATEVRDDGSGR